MTRVDLKTCSNLLTMLEWCRGHIPCQQPGHEFYLHVDSGQVCFYFADALDAITFAVVWR